METSFSIFEKEHDAREKYIYFICGVAGALFAYTAKDYTPHRPMMGYDKVMLGTLLALVLSFAFGCLHMYFRIRTLNYNRNLWICSETIKDGIKTLRNPHPFMTIDGKTFANPVEMDNKLREVQADLKTNREKMNAWDERGERVFAICHIFLLAGFILLIWSKFVD